MYIATFSFEAAAQAMQQVTSCRDRMMMTHLASIMPVATPWPRKPQNMPARLYSSNLTPRQAALLSRPYSRTPGKEASKTALGTF